MFTKLPLHTLRLLGVLLATAVALQLHALDVTLTVPGTLREAVGADFSVEELTVEGPMDASDFSFLADNLTHLTTLNLSRAEIRPYAGAPTRTGRLTSPAHTLPECALMSLPLASLTLPEGLQSIDAGALAATQLRFVALPKGVKEIGEGAFANSPLLAQVVIPEGVTAIPAGAFKDCPVLESVSLPSTLTHIGNRAFAGCVGLKNVTFPPSLTAIGAEAFTASGVMRADLSASPSLERVGEWAFAECSNLREVEFPASLAWLGEGAFFMDKSLEINQLPAGVESIPSYAFTAAAGTGGEVTLPEGLRTVGAHALTGWSGVQTLRLCATLDSIGTRAMAGWSTLREIDGTTLVGVPRLGEAVWEGIYPGNVRMVVERETFPLFNEADQWREFELVQRTDGVTLTPSDDTAADLLTARFEGTLLTVAAPQPILSVELYDMAGRRFSLPGSRSGEESVTLDTAPWNGGVMVVHVVLADGSSAALKLTR